MLSFLAIYALFLIGEHANLLYRSDISIQYPSFLTEENKQDSEVHLVSYADGAAVFHKNQLGQAYSALNKGFDHIHMYKKRDMDAEFTKKNKNILSIKAGAGLWIWKAYFMLRTMENSPEDSIIVYADSPVIFQKPIAPILKLLEKHDVLLLKDGSERKGNVRIAQKGVKREAFQYFNLDRENVWSKPNVWACLVIVRNNKNGRAFVKQWLSNCQVEDAIMENPLDPKIQYPAFEGHAYDQAMLFIASQQKPQRVYVMDVDEIKGIIKNVHRHPREEFKSLLPDTIGWFKISEWGYNSGIFQKIRNMLSGY